ncbi:hypothetical protein E4T49_07106 [Aureobasidium sp. EXF-10728]|nr:hypothetical protein E4T49_07106 [Aureobasidium sp. EXF-10728]
MDWHDKWIPILAVTIAMIVLPLIVVPLRCYVRITRRSFKIDDWLIIAALILHLGACAVALWGFNYGLGLPDKVLSLENQIKGVQTFAMYKPIYTLATCLIKCSVCYTFLRLSTSPKITRALHWILIIVICSSLIMFVGSFVYCVPYSAIWTHWHHPNTPGYCLPGAVVLTVGYSFACVTIFADFACAIIPGIILWQTIMSTRNMIVAWFVLGLGVLAAAMTVCRLPYIAYWNHETDMSYGLGRILLFELLECGIGIFASCAPALKPWFSASMTSLTSLLHRLTKWTTVGSHISVSNHKYHHNLQDLEKAEHGEHVPSVDPASATAAPPVPRMDLVIPDIEDTVMDTVMDGYDKGWDGYEYPTQSDRPSAVPVIIVSRVRAESGDYTNTWDIVREEDGNDGPSRV